MKRRIRNRATHGAAVTMLFCVLFANAALAQSEPYSGGQPGGEPTIIDDAEPDEDTVVGGEDPDDAEPGEETVVGGETTDDADPDEDAYVKGDTTDAEPGEEVDLRGETVPEAVTDGSGILPFTGAQITLFVLIGLGAVILGALMMRKAKASP
ncbi:MAG: hypothetical protein H0U53_04385 [Actinobacteria bacterium]|nr:hypothetical protein [Actinomycetota bacterium]